MTQADGETMSFRKIWNGSLIALTAMSLAGCDGRAFTLERDLSPLIGALDAYHSDTSAYPEKLEQLTPRYISSIPNCPAEHRPDVSYHRRADGTFIIQCEVGVLLLFPQFAIYESDARTWHYGG